MCVAMQMGTTHDEVLDSLSIPQVFLYWENISVLQGYGKPGNASGRPDPKESPEWVWDRAKREYVPFAEEKRETYFWNRKLRQYER